jgi:hypothetical protein
MHGWLFTTCVCVRVCADGVSGGMGVATLEVTSASDGSWLKTTCMSALSSLVRLQTRFSSRLAFLLPDLLTLLESCISQGVALSPRSMSMSSLSLSPSGSSCSFVCVHISGASSARVKGWGGWGCCIFSYYDTMRKVVVRRLFLGRLMRARLDDRCSSLMPSRCGGPRQDRRGVPAAAAGGDRFQVRRRDVAPAVLDVDAAVRGLDAARAYLLPIVLPVVSGG